jgi:2-iminobutanoate/2-iminopropanoate deaminase
MRLVIDEDVPTQVFFTNLDDFSEFNEVYAQYFPQKPARTAVEVRRMPMGLTLEMELIAVE